MIYDIRNSTNAQQTLVSLTGVPLSIWKQNVGREREFQYADDLVEYVVSSYGKLPENYRDFHFVYFHITTSANGCASFRKHGILDLPNSYLCADSELRVFLENHNIYIDLQHEVLRYGEKTFNIHYGRCPRQDTEEYHCWSVPTISSRSMMPSINNTNPPLPNWIRPRRNWIVSPPPSPLATTNWARQSARQTNCATN